MENKNWDESIAGVLADEAFNLYWEDIKKQDMTPKMRAATFLLLGYLSAKEEQGDNRPELHGLSQQGT